MIPKTIKSLPQFCGQCFRRRTPQDNFELHRFQKNWVCGDCLCPPPPPKTVEEATVEGNMGKNDLNWDF